MKPQRCRITIHAGAYVYRATDGRAFTMSVAATTDAMPLQNDRGMTTRYHFTTSSGASYTVSGAYATFIEDLPRYALDGVAGLVARTTSVAGHTVSIYYALEALLDPAGGNWVTVCEEHATLCNHTTRTRAESHLKTAGWCEACMDEMRAH